jgi:hypothetical protein
LKHCKICDTVKPLTEYTSNGYYKGRKKYKPECKLCEYIKYRERFTSIMTGYYGKLACTKCGYDKCVASLDLHHRNPSEKEHNPSKMLTHSKDKILNEFAKCDLLCANCHRELHYLSRR